MQNFRSKFAGLCSLMLLLSVASVRAMPQGGSNLVGTWEMTMAMGRQNGGPGNRRGGPGVQSLTITQDGDKFKISHKTPRGENTYYATVSGGAISWTEERQGRDGNTMKVEYKANLNGDTLEGTMSGGQFNRGFTAKRSN